MSGPPGVALPMDALSVLKRSLSLRGAVIERGDARFEQEREVWNRNVKCEPSRIIYCCQTSDVVAALNYCRETDSEFTVAGGRHTIHCCKQDAVMISLAGLRSVQIDVSAKMAYVGGGARNGDLDEACAPFHLATPAGTNPDTGVGGLINGGGVGYLSRRYGLSIDNLVSAHVVTWDGKVVIASESSNADLFWGLRGAGFNFGVVTQFQLRLHRIGHDLARFPNDAAFDGAVLSGVAICPLAAVNGAMAAVREFEATVGKDRDFVIVIAVTDGPPGMGKVVIVNPSYLGSNIQVGLDGLAKLRASLPKIIDTIRPMTYLELQRSMLDHQQPSCVNEKALFVKAIDDAVVQKLANAINTVPEGGSHSVFVIIPFDAAVQEVAPDATAFPHRVGSQWIAVIGVHDDNETARLANKEWVQNVKDDFARDGLVTGMYANTVDHAESEQIFLSAAARLKQIKAKWDPHNRFHNNHNIKP